MKSFQEILEEKRDYYGDTEAAIEFAAEEYSLIRFKEWSNLISGTSITLNLMNYKQKDFKNGVFGGTPQSDLSLIYFEERYYKVIIQIPEETNSISPFFFERLIFEVVEKLGIDGFNERFKFESLGNYNFERNLQEAFFRIKRTLRSKNWEREEEKDEEIEIKVSRFKMNKPFSSFIYKDRNKYTLKELWILSFKDPAYVSLMFLMFVFIFYLLFKI